MSSNLSINCGDPATRAARTAIRSRFCFRPGSLPSPLQSRIVAIWRVSSQSVAVPSSKCNRHYRDYFFPRKIKKFGPDLSSPLTPSSRANTNSFIRSLSWRFIINRCGSLLRCPPPPPRHQSPRLRRARPLLGPLRRALRRPPALRSLRHPAAPARPLRSILRARHRSVRLAFPSARGPMRSDRAPPAVAARHLSPPSYRSISSAISRTNPTHPAIRRPASSSSPPPLPRPEPPRPLVMRRIPWP
jgi:hypothetical protein